MQTPENVVSSEICRICHFWREPPPEHFRRFPLLARVERIVASLERLTGATCGVRDAEERERWIFSRFPHAESALGLRAAAVVVLNGAARPSRRSIAQLAAEAVDVVVVDPAAEYVALDREIVLRPGKRGDWASACNAALEFLQHLPYERFIVLSEAGEVGPGGCAALVARLDAQLDAGLLVAAGEGDALLLTRHLLEWVGPFDHDRCGDSRAAAVLDLSIRAKLAGLRVVGVSPVRGANTNDIPACVAGKWGAEAAELIGAASCPAPGISRFNLIYHVAPFRANDVWRLNVAQILRRIHLFNGKRVVAIATGPELEPPERVEREFAGRDVTFIHRPNDRTLREVTTFLPLLESVHSLAGDEATFYAHAKGVTSIGDPTGVTYWRNSMYHALLDDLPLVKKSLAEYPCVGTHRRRHPSGRRVNDPRVPIFPDGTDDAPWHFAGTFWWFRNRDLFAHPRWGALRQSGWFAEGYLSFLFPYERTCCLFMDEAANPYNRNSYRTPIPDPRPAGGASPGAAQHTAARRVELGGGTAPRGDGFVNVDRLDHPAVDVRVDFEQLGRGACRLPFDDDSVDEIYSSHCLEHVWPYEGLLREIARVCRLGAPVELRVPHWNQQMAMCNDHKHTVGPDQVRHWTDDAVEHWWHGCAKRLRLLRTEWVPSGRLAEAKRLFPHLSDEQVMRFIPDTCHENRFHFFVVENAPPNSRQRAAGAAQAPADARAVDGVLGRLAKQGPPVAEPFPHLVIDGLFPPELLRAAAAEFPPFDWPHWVRYDSPLERKLSCNRLEHLPERLAALLRRLNRPDVAATVGQVMGISGLQPDTTLHGAGLHMIGPGGKLDIHLDYAVHPHCDLERRVNWILYLNENWDDAWGGELELWASDMSHCAVRIAPRFNRLVLFEVGDHAYHGHPEPLRCPADVCRRSIALYFLSTPRGDTSPRPRAQFVPRPNDAPDGALDQLRARRAAMGTESGDKSMQLQPIVVATADIEPSRTPWRRLGPIQDPGTLTLFVPLAGRAALWPGFTEFLDQQNWPHDQARLVLFDTSQDDAFSRHVREWLAVCDYADVRHIRAAVGEPGLADRPRGAAVGEVTLAMTRIYNRLAREATSDYVWIVEDDVLPPLDACERLLRAFDERTASVSGVYPSRFKNGYVVWQANQQKYLVRGQGVQTVGGNGFGCVVLRGEVLRETVFTSTIDYPAYDNAFYQRLAAAGLVAKIDWAVVCDHRV